jgi:hypothetical protein
VWGYDPEFMALMPAALEVAGEDITAGDVWIATGADGQIAGGVALRVQPCAGYAGLDAAGFYERNGAVRIGEARSDAVPGRLLPLYELRLYPAG